MCTFVYCIKFLYVNNKLPCVSGGLFSADCWHLLFSVRARSCSWHTTVSSKTTSVWSTMRWRSRVDLWSWRRSLTAANRLVRTFRALRTPSPVNYRHCTTCVNCLSRTFRPKWRRYPPSFITTQTVVVYLFFIQIICVCRGCIMICWDYVYWYTRHWIG